MLIGLRHRSILSRDHRERLLVGWGNSLLARRCWPDSADCWFAWRSRDLMGPVRRWNPEQRRERVYQFVRDEVFPRRLNMLAIADQIASLNEQQLNAGNQQVGSLFAQFRLRLGITLAITLGLGLVLAAFSMLRILRLERDGQFRDTEIARARGGLKGLAARMPV